MLRTIAAGTAALVLIAVPHVVPAQQAGEGEVLDEVVAVVNEGIILRSDLELRVRRVRQRLQRKDTRMPPEDILQEQVLKRLISEEIQVQRAQRSDLRVAESRVDEAVRQIAERNGVSLEVFTRQLEQEGIPFARFRDQVRRQILIDKLQRRDVARRVSITEDEVDRFLEEQGGESRDNTQYHLRHILVALPQDPAPEEVSRAREEIEQLRERIRNGADFGQVAIQESDGQQALEGGDLGWRKGNQLPTIFAKAVTRLQPGEVSEPIRSSSGFHLVELADQRGGPSRVQVQEFKTRQILIEPDELTSSEQARRELRSIRERIQRGEADFAEMARYHSDDMETASRGGDMGWLRARQLSPRMERIFDGLSPGEISQPIRADAGWRIVQLVDQRTRDATEESRRNRARQALFQRKMEEETKSYLQRLRDEAYVDIRLDTG